MPINKSNIKPFACRVTRINGTRNKSITSNLARKGFNKMQDILTLSTAALSVLALLIVPVVITNNTSASTILHFNIDADPSLTITLQNEDGANLANNSSTLHITPTAGGAFDSQDIKVAVGTNNYAGYYLTMKATDSTSLNGPLLPGGENATIEAIPTKTNGYTENEFISSSDTLNKWGYMIKSTRLTSGTDYVPNYNPISATTDIRINNCDTSCKDGLGNGLDTTTVTFAAKLNNDIPNGSYGTTISFSAVANPNPTCYANGCTINYSSNGVTANGTTTPTMAAQTVTSGTSSALLRPSNFKNPAGTTSTSGYGFAGWNTKADGTGINYGPMETIDTNTIYAGGVTLYAKWIQSTGDMQGWTGCSSMSVGQVTALRDNRDNNVYAIGKFYDGGCWMMENLRLTNGYTLNSSNTDNPATGFVLAATTDDWCSTGTESNCVNQSMLNTQNITSTGTYPSSTSDVYSYGNYYNWYSATAGNGTFSSDPSGNTATNTASGSICPKGWRLPVGGGLPNPDSSAWGDNSANSDFYALGKTIVGTNIINNIDNNLYNDSTTNSSYYKSKSDLFRAYPYNIVLSGDKVGQLIQNRPWLGYLWTSTAGNGRTTYYATLTTINVIPGTYRAGRQLGFSVRCLASN
ncbi:InlB B-repeat-containing protein [Candidatus Saccharibacteria bacterium]|nr:InlB B-repeat-containing protein [Candidatus Saccharibacteria bacterium]